VADAGEVSARRALSDLGRARATGSLVLDSRSGQQARVYFNEGSITAIQMPDHRPRIGMRLVAAGVISPDQLAVALQRQRLAIEGADGASRLDQANASRRLGDVLVALGAVSRSVVEQIARAQLADALAALLSWDAARVGFEAQGPGQTQPFEETPVSVDHLLADADARQPMLLELVRRLGGPAAVPDLAGIPTVDPHPTLGPHDWALLCKIDGQRSLADLAMACGFTMLEAAQIIDGLISSGLVTVTAPPQPQAQLDEVDTAALLRELSGLSAPRSAPARRTPAPAGANLSAAEKQKRKAGFFSR